MKTITLATFDTPEQAEPLKRRLDELHIAARIHGGRALKKLWFAGKPRAEVKVEIEVENGEQAFKLMHELEAEPGIVRNVVRCPKCKSMRVEYPQFTRKFFLPNLVGLLAGLGLVEKKYYCEDCHNTWMPRDRRHHKHRSHMAPYYFLEDVQAGLKSEEKNKSPG